MNLSLTLITLIGTAIITPTLTLITLWFKNRNSFQERRDKEYQKYVDALIKDVETLKTELIKVQQHLEEKETAIRTIQTELKNRDEEYLKLFQSNNTLRAQYDNLLADHTKLKIDYDATVAELTQLKSDIKQKADEAAQSIQKL
jgi:uncharacterized protein (DUF3084 family)